MVSKQAVIRLVKTSVLLLLIPALVFGPIAAYAEETKPPNELQEDAGVQDEETVQLQNMDDSLKKIGNVTAEKSDSRNSQSATASVLTLNQLREKFPAGKYWNHAGNPGSSNKVNNQDGFTSTPCPKHKTVGTSAQTCNGFQPEGTQLSWQCMGYAEKLGYDSTGFNPRTNANGWTTSYSSSALNNLKPGDIVRYKSDGHSIFVTGVSGDTVTYTDCNSDGHCVIRWDATISKQTLRSTFTHVRISPGIKVIPDPDIRPYYTPLTCYTVSTGNVTTYTSASGSTTSGYITGSTDQCVINTVYVNGRVKVTYPTPSGSKTAYANLSDFISSADAVSEYSYSVSSNTTVYRRKDMSESIGTAYSTDKITVVGESGGHLQIIYPISGGYKLGWISGNSTPSGDTNTVDTRYPTPVSAYTNKSGNVTTYSAVNGGSSGVIYTSDLCKINEVYTNGWCKVTYPTSSGSKTAYTQFSNFLDSSCSVTPSRFTPSQTLTVYTRKDLSTTFGSVWSTDNCTLVASTGSLRQIIYPLDAGGYKMGWVSLPADVPTVSWPMPLKAYINSPTDRAAVYEGIGTNSGYGQIFVDDLCTINAVYTNGWVNVTYPVSSGTKTGYVPLSVFVPNQITAYSVTAAKQVYTYRKSDMSTQFGYADPGDNCIIIGKSGDRVQMIYPISGGYKLGWAYANDFTKSLTGLSIGSKPTKTTYIEGESLNTSGLVVNASYSDNTTAAVTGYTLSGYSSTPGEKTVTVSYTEGGITKTTAFSVTVKGKSPTKLTITKQPSRVTYLEGNSDFDFSDMTVTVTYNNGTNSVVTGYELFGMSTEIGTHIITVKYTENGVSVSTNFVVTVRAKSLTMIYPVYPEGSSNEIVVNYGEELDLSSIRVIAYYDNGDSEEITDYTVQGFDSTKVGRQVVTLTYQDQSAELAVLVLETTNVMTDPDMVLPANLITIEEEAFRGCGARWIKLSEQVEEIGDYAFADCSNLSQIYIPENTIRISTTAFNGLSNSLTIYGKDGSYAEFYAGKLGLKFVGVD